MLRLFKYTIFSGIRIIMFLGRPQFLEKQITIDLIMLRLHKYTYSFLSFPSLPSFLPSWNLFKADG